MRTLSFVALLLALSAGAYAQPSPFTPPVSASALPSISTIPSTSYLIVSDPSGTLSKIACSSVTGISCGAGSPSIAFTSLANGTQAGSAIAGALTYANGTPSGLTYSWNTPCAGTGSAGSFSASAGVISATFTPPPSTNGTCTLSVTGTGANTASATSSAVTISAPGSPTLALTTPANGATGLISSTVSVTGTYANGTPTAVGCVWNPGAIAGAVTSATISGGTFSETCSTPSSAATYSLVVTGTGANTASDTHTGIVLSAGSSAAFTALSAVPAAIGTVGAANTIVVTVNSGDVCGLPSSVTIDGTTVTASTPVTVDSTHCSFTVVGPAVSSTTYAAHVLNVHGAGSGGQIASNATTTMLSRVVVAYNSNSTSANISTGSQGGSGINPGNVYFGINGSDAVNANIYFSRPNDYTQYTSMPAFELGTSQQLLAFFSSDKLTVPGNSLHLGGFGDWFNTMNTANATYHQFSGSVNAWAAGSYYFIMLTPDGGVFVNASATTIT